MTKDSGNRRIVWWVIAAVLFVGALIAAALFRPAQKPVEVQSQPVEVAQSEPTSVEEQPQSEPEVEATEPQQEVSEMPDLSRRIADDPLAMGDVDAPVVMIEFADFRCPFCGVFARETLPVLIEEYVDTGLLRIEWWDTPIFGGESVDAAVAARAAGQQDMFWEYYNQLFEYEGNDHQDLPRERLLEIAGEVGVPDMDRFQSDLESEELLEAVNSDFGVAVSIGAYSTPAFIIGTIPLMGAQPLEVFEATIDEALSQVGAAR